MREAQTFSRRVRSAAKAAVLYQLGLGSVLLFGEWPGVRGSLWELDAWPIAALFVVPAAMLIAVWADVRGRSAAWACLLPLGFGAVGAVHVNSRVQTALVAYPELATIFSADRGLTALGLGLMSAGYVTGFSAWLARERSAVALGRAAFAAWLWLLGSQAHVFGQAVGLFGCKCMLGQILEEANGWFGLAHDLTWVGGAALGGMTMACLVHHRRGALGPVVLVLTSAAALGGIEHHATKAVLAPLTAPTVPDDVRMPTGDQPAVNAVRTLPARALFVGERAIHQHGARIAATSSLTTPSGCRTVAESVVPRRAHGYLSVDVVMDARLPYRAMRCLQRALTQALDAADVTPHLDGSRHTWVTWLYAAGPPQPRREGVLKSVGPAMGELTLDGHATTERALELRLVDQSLVLKARGAEYRHPRGAADRRRWLSETFWRVCGETHPESSCHLRLRLPGDVPVGYVTHLLGDGTIVVRSE